MIAPPAQKIPNTTAVFSGLDKITGRIISFDVAINETVQFGALQVTPRVCYTRPRPRRRTPTPSSRSDEITLQGEIKRVFTGWMFAASPGLHAIEHPIYDVWLADCKGAQQPAVAAAPEAVSPAAPQRPQKQQPAKQKQAAPASAQPRRRRRSKRSRCRRLPAHPFSFARVCTQKCDVRSSSGEGGGKRGGKKGGGGGGGGEGGGGGGEGEKEGGRGGREEGGGRGERGEREEEGGEGEGGEGSQAETREAG